MQSLAAVLAGQGYKRLDTDTAVTNRIAQHFYENNGFERRGTTRSFYYKQGEGGTI